MKWYPKKSVKLTNHDSVSSTGYSTDGSSSTEENKKPPAVASKKKGSLTSPNRRTNDVVQVSPTTPHKNTLLDSESDSSQSGSLL